jgi:hypothetical protein
MTKTTPYNDPAKIPTRAEKRWLWKCRPGGIRNKLQGLPHNIGHQVNWSGRPPGTRAAEQAKKRGDRNVRNRLRRLHDLSTISN